MHNPNSSFFQTHYKLYPISTNMTLRTATIHDTKDIARIHVDTWKQAYQGIVPKKYLASLSKEIHEKKWEHTLTNSPAGTLVILSENSYIVGWASTGPSRDDDNRNVGELYAIYLDHQHWGQGIGKKLMESSISKLLKNGFKNITIWVLEANIRARRFYEKLGFVYDGTNKIINIGGEELSEIRYHKEF